jgi:transcriptional regulator of acetoin/glycerol metabolism
VLLPEHLPEAVADSMDGYGRPTTRNEDARLAKAPQADGMPSDAELRTLLGRHGGNVAAVGRELGKARMQIHRWMKRYGIEVDDYRG